MNEFQKIVRKALYNPSYSKRQVLNLIKSELNAGEYEMAINSNRLLVLERLKNGFFQSVEEIYQRDVFGFTNDVRRELYWIIFDLKSNSEVIIAFLNRKKEFEKLFILNKLDEAEKCLEIIRLEFGESLWSIEMSLLLKEYASGTQENWELLSSYLSDIASPFYQFLMNFYSKRIEENMSFENCFTQFQNDLDGVMSETMVRDFLVFKSLFNANFDYDHKNYEGVLYIAGIFSVIDQYLIFVEVLTKLATNDEKNDKMLIQALKKLQDLVPFDNKLKNLRNLIDSNIDISLFDNNELILSIIDFYAEGKFEDCLILCKNALPDNPVVFELYELYAKSLINLKRPFEPIIIGKFVDDIIEALYKSLLFNKESETYRNKLFKYSLIFLSSDFGKQLSVFVSSLVGINSEADMLIGSVYSDFNNPRFFAQDLEGRKLGMLKKYGIFENRASFKVNLYLLGDTLTNGSTFVSECKVQSDVYLARHLYNNSKYIEVIDVIREYVGGDISPFYYDNILLLLFDSYVKTNQYVEAMILYTTLLVKDEYSVNKFDVSNLILKIKEAGYDNYAEYIDLPILFGATEKDYDLYECYIEFMLYNDEEYPSKLDIENISRSFSNEKLIYFLNKICVVSTMQYSLEFSSISKAEQERIEICNILKKIDSTNSSSYDREISEILRVSAVRKAIKEVDQGRLYVNIERLKNLQITNARESFARFKEIELTTKAKGLIGFNSSKERNWIDVDFKQRENTQKFDDPAFLAFKSIYLETRDKFLYSKEYGLDACLSTNFRHGAVKNHIRSVFENLNLITSKLGDKYVENLNWNTEVEPEHYNNFQARLKKFSKEIDDYTVEIVNNLIQIKTERHPEKKDALFFYGTDDETLWRFFEGSRGRINSVEYLIDTLYTDLTNFTTSTICINIYNVFLNKINKRFQEYIENLSSDLKKLGVSVQSGLIYNILKSSTNIQAELEVISEWFLFNTTSSSSLLDIETLIEASKEYTNKINPKNNINPTINIYFSFQQYSSSIYVFNILFNNIIEHSKLREEEMDVTVDVFIPKGNYFEIKFSNNISESVNVNQVRKKLQEVKDNWNNHDNIERSNVEGGSGFDKIKRILIYETINKTDRFEFLVENNRVDISLFLHFRKEFKNIEDVLISSVNFGLDTLDFDRYSYNIHDKSKDFMVPNTLFFAFNFLIRKMIDLSEMELEDVIIAVDILEPSATYFETIFKIPLNPRASKSVEETLSEVKRNWNNLTDDEAIKDDFDRIKRNLIYEANMKSDRFDYIVSNESLSISLFLDYTKLPHEEDIDN